MVAPPRALVVDTLDPRLPHRHPESALPLTRLRQRCESDAFVPQQGDLVFGNRLSWVQMAQNLAADQWTHAALVVELGNELCVIEFGPKGCVTRSLADFRRAYRFIGFARPIASQPCRDRLVSWARDQLGRQATYSWLHFAVVGFSSLARRLAPERSAPLVERVSRDAADRVDARNPDAMLCSSFIWDGLMQICESCRPHVAWPARDRVVPWRARPSVTDVDHRGSSGPCGAGDRAARLLANPSDIWVAGGYELKVVLDGDHATALLDLRSDPRPSSRSCCARLEPVDPVPAVVAHLPRTPLTTVHALGA